MTPCEQCKGACCESITVIPPTLEDGAFWLTRGEPCLLGVSLPLRCKHLTEEGRCKIYATRPNNCRNFEVGSAVCRATIIDRKRNVVFD